MEIKRALEVGLMLGWQDLRQAYRRSKLGQFWLTLSMAMQITTIALVFGLIFHVSLSQYLPFVSTGLILWGLISSNLNDGCTAFINSEAIIKQLRLPLLTHIVRSVWKNFLTFLHNLVILPFVFIVTGKTLGWELMLVPVGLILVLWNLTWISFSLAVITSRFRDVQQIIAALSLMLFYLTPVMWYPSALPASTAHYLLGLNPFYHLYQLMRQPIIGEIPTFENYALSVLFAIVGTVFAYFLSRQTSKRVAYWV